MPNDLLTRNTETLSPTGAGGSPSKQGIAADGPPKLPGSDKDVQARINELVARESYYKRKASELEQSVQAQNERLARLEGRAETSSQRETSSRPKDWSDMTDQQLEEAVTMALSDDTKSPAAMAQILREYRRRAKNDALAESSAESQKQINQTQLIRDTNSRILQDFGAEAFDETSPLYEAAYRHMAEYVRLYGKEEVKARPTFRYDAFLRAEREVKTSGERERLQALEQENQSLHTRASLLERGGAIGAAPKPSDEVRDLLKSQGPKAAIRKLRLTQSLVDDVRRRAVVPER